jgi:hypothetical protein
MNVTSLTSFALSYKEEESTIQTILAMVINASVYDSTATSNPDNRRYKSSQRRPVVYRDPGSSNPPSSAMRRLPSLSSYLCSSRLQNCRGGRLSRIPGYCRGGRPDAQHVTGCPVSSPPGARQRPSMALIQGLPSLPFLHSTGLGFNWVTGIPLQRSCTIAKNRAWMSTLNCQCRGCTCPSRRNCSTSFCHPGLLPRTRLKIGAKRSGFRLEWFW